MAIGTVHARGSSSTHQSTRLRRGRGELRLKQGSQLPDNQEEDIVSGCNRNRRIHIVSAPTRVGSGSGAVMLYACPSTTCARPQLSPLPATARPNPLLWYGMVWYNNSSYEDTSLYIASRIA
eukprot:6209637-Pleurochrysis_carterae.AAC.1